MWWRVAAVVRMSSMALTLMGLEFSEVWAPGVQMVLAAVW